MHQHGIHSALRGSASLLIFFLPRLSKCVMVLIWLQARHERDKAKLAARRKRKAARTMAEQRRAQRGLPPKPAAPSRNCLRG